MAQFKGPFSIGSVDGLKTPAYIFLPGGEKKTIGEVTVKVEGGMTFDVDLDETHKGVETASFDVPMRFTYFNLPDRPKVNWGFNSLTPTVHHGRPEAIWKLSLMQTVYMFSPSQLQKLVVDRIYNDAMELVKHGVEPDGPTQEWAERVKQAAGPLVLPTYQRKIGEISTYYRSMMFKRDFDDAIARNENDRLNPNYQPVHDHDSVNMLCRIVGHSAMDKARRDSES